MSRKFTFWLDSGANIHSRREETMTLEEMGIDDEEYDAMSEEDRESFFKDFAFAYADWGWEETDEEEEE